MDPSMMGGGMPPGAAPPMDPAMMGGGMPPGAPPMDPSMMGGGMPPGMPPAAPPQDPAAAAGQAAPPKMKPEQWMQMLDFRIYNLQMQLTAIMNALNVQLPPGALVMPPGSPTPVPEAALPGGAQDPSASAAPPAGGGSAIAPIDPMQGASPELAGQKAAADLSFSQFMDTLTSDDAHPVAVGQAIGPVGSPFGAYSPTTNAAAVAAMLRSRTAGQ